MKTIVSFLLLVCISPAFGQHKTLSFKDDKLSCTYETTQGRLNGNYTSYYENGKKKAEGKFENNYRAGTWAVWDSTGTVNVQRKYENPFLFTFSEDQTNRKKDKVADVRKYKLQKNKDSYYEYFQLKESMIVWSKKVWKYLPLSDNELLSSHRLFDLVHSKFLNGNIRAYDAKQDEFSAVLNTREIDTTGLILTGFRTKEVPFFDTCRMVFESRIIGLCPVALSKDKKDTVDLYWLYFPELRKYLASEKLDENYLPSSIKNLDDLFFFRYYTGIICKIMDGYDYKDIKDGREAEKIELSYIENEHDLWIRFAGK